MNFWKSYIASQVRSRAGALAAEQSLSPSTDAVRQSPARSLRERCCSARRVRHTEPRTYPQHRLPAQGEHRNWEPTETRVDGRSYDGQHWPHQVPCWRIVPLNINQRTRVRRITPYPVVNRVIVGPSRIDRGAVVERIATSTLLNFLISRCRRPIPRPSPVRGRRQNSEQPLLPRVLIQVEGRLSFADPLKSRNSPGLSPDLEASPESSNRKGPQIKASAESGERATRR